MNTERENRRVGSLVIAAFVMGVLLTGAVFYFFPILPSLATTQQAANAVVNPTGTGLIADMVDKTSPAVVLIQTTVESRDSRYDAFFSDPFFRQFFGNRVPMDSGPRYSQGMGSGFIISKDGYILTNEHVIHGASKIEVAMSGRDEPVPARLVGSDAELDLAVLKINGEANLPYLQLGNSDTVRVGEWAVAIGNPQGLDHTVTVGVISAKGRPIAVQNKQYKNLLQTDASINPGNSGGPLLNTKGEVIGINTAVSATAQGIGFAIPTSTVKPVLDSLINQGKITRPWLGVYIQSLDQEIARQLHFNSTEGAVITSVVEGGPADNAGIAQGDILVQIDGNKVATAGDLTTTVGKKKPGDRAEVILYRNGKKLILDVLIGEKGNVD